MYEASQNGRMDAHVASLLESFRRVSPEAVPAVLDCGLTLSGFDPSSIICSLIDAFPTLSTDAREQGKLEDQGGYLASFMTGLCHLLKKSGGNHGVLQLFIWKCYIPLMTMMHGYDGEIFYQTAESFIHVLIETNAWGVVETGLVPACLRSIILSMGMFEINEPTIHQWSDDTCLKDFNEEANIIELHREFLLGPFPLPLSCYILASMLDAALQSHKAARGTSEVLLTTGFGYAEKFAGNLLWDLCNLTVSLFSQGLEHRSCVLGSFLPCVFKAFVVQGSFEIPFNGKRLLLSRKYFFRKLWICCRTLFSLGSSERRDAYRALSLYFSFFSCTSGCGNAIATDCTEEFDIRDYEDFWDEIKRGLVDKEGLVRKQCLHILKTSLHINERSECYAGVSGGVLHGNSSTQYGKTRRELWADKEANSLGVGKIYNSFGNCPDGLQRWEAFLLLYEMLEEYGTHLVEAAWNHQITFLLHFSSPDVRTLKSTGNRVYQNQMDALEGVYDWLGILWERGLHHDNPQVRCLIMQSFLGIEWKNLGSHAKLVSENFILGPFILGLNDNVQHKNFGVRGVYSSDCIEGATKFLHQYTSQLTVRTGIAFLKHLASLAKQHSFGRAGLMGLAKCIASAACGIQARELIQAKDGLHNLLQEKDSAESHPPKERTELLDVLRFVIENSKQHFNPNYRLQVCENVLEAAVSLVCASAVPLEVLMHFLSALPREFTDYRGFLRVKVQEWLLGCRKKDHSSDSLGKIWPLTTLYDFPINYIQHQHSIGFVNTCDDEDLESWESEATRWARVLFLLIKEDHDLDPILMFIENYRLTLSLGNELSKRENLKFLLLISRLVHEIELMQDRTVDCCMKVNCQSELDLPGIVNQSCRVVDIILGEKFSRCFLSILDGLVSFANSSCSIFWTRVLTSNAVLPSAVTGKLGGPSQRRMSSFMTTAVLQAITSMKALSFVSSWSALSNSDASSLSNAFTFLWEFFWKIVSSPSCDSEAGAEVLVAAYEALSHVLKALASGYSLSVLNFILKSDRFLVPQVHGEPLLDTLVLTFLQNINNLIALGVLARSRCAVLMNWKWLCLESLLSTPVNALEGGGCLDDSIFFFSESAARVIFCDIVESLENAGEGFMLPMLRSLRLVLDLFSSGSLHPIVSSHVVGGVDTKMMWQIVRPSWILHVSCRKRRVAPIAALLSSVLHSSVFSDESMHGIDDAPGPLKWFVRKLLEEGTKSPRTIRLVALHLTGLWLLNPNIIKYYLKELKLLSLYGSVAFDEDFEAELIDNRDARTEVSLLAKSPNPELTEAFINTELYARASIAVLFSKLADLTDSVGSGVENCNYNAACEAGKLFLLELLDSVVNDKDLAKELYKKYSGIHRRKVRALQMLCILSRFIDEDIIPQVGQSLHICLYRNNLPAVRQYLETFAIYLYLKFPSLAGEQLVPIFRQYDMKPQALSSYVFIAANVILHAPEIVKYKHLDELLPPVIPLLTSHHHSLRGFTQLLVYQVLSKLFPLACSFDSMPLEKRCFEDLKSYLEKNSDCMKLRSSMIGYLDGFDPKIATSPSGIFCNQNVELEFECVPTPLMEQVIAFLNVVRDDLRCSMAKDAAIMKNESLLTDGDLKCSYEIEANKNYPLSHVSLDFQKKVTLHKHDMHHMEASSLNRETCKHLLELEKEDLILERLVHSRSSAMESISANRQDFILVASLLDRIPNLAGLARTCEVFKAAGLAIADKNILQDKQFQLISVTAEKWLPIMEVPVSSVKVFLEKKKRDGFSILGLEQTANSIALDQYIFPKKTVLVLGQEKEGIPVDIIHTLDACIEIPQFGVVRSLNVHVSGAIALWEYTHQQRLR